MTFTARLRPVQDPSSPMTDFEAPNMGREQHTEGVDFIDLWDYENPWPAALEGFIDRPVGSYQPQSAALNSRKRQRGHNHDLPQSEGTENKRTRRTAHSASGLHRLPHVSSSNEQTEQVTVPVDASEGPPAAPPAKDVLKLKYISKQECLRQNVPANIWLPADMQLRFYEIQVFLPTMNQLPLAMQRQRRNGASAMLMARLQLHGRNELNSANASRVNDRLKKQKCAGISIGQSCTSGKDQELPAGAQNDMTSASWMTRKDHKVNGGRRGFFGHVRLSELYRDVDRRAWPKKEDAGALTVCLNFDLQHHELELYTSHLPWILTRIQWKDSRQASGIKNFDEEDIARWGTVNWKELEAEGDRRGSITPCIIDKSRSAEQVYATVKASTNIQEKPRSPIAAGRDNIDGQEHDIHAQVQEDDAIFDLFNLVPLILTDHIPSAHETVEWLQLGSDGNGTSRETALRLLHWCWSRGWRGQGTDSVQVLEDALSRRVRGG